MKLSITNGNDMHLQHHELYMIHINILLNTVARASFSNAHISMYVWFLVSKVVNLSGPQTQVFSPVKIKEEKPENVLPGVEERLRNIEDHLKIKTGNIKLNYLSLAGILLSELLVITNPVLAIKRVTCFWSMALHCH